MQTTTPRPNASTQTEKWVNRNPTAQRKQTEAVRPTYSRPKCGREMGQRGQASGPRTRPRVPPRVRCGPTWQPDSTDPSSPPRVLASLRRRALASSRASLAGIDATPGCLRGPSMPYASMTALGGERHAASAFIRQALAHRGHTHPLMGPS
jgi:hypothetical protein